MSQLLEISLGQLLFFGFGSSLLLSGLILLIRQFGQSFFLSLCLLIMGINLIAEVFTFLPLKEIMVLMLWPAFYLHTRQRHQRIDWLPSMGLHFLVPILWMVVRWFHLTEHLQGHEAIAFLQFVPYVILSLVELYRQYSSRTSQKVLQSSYLLWSYAGLVTLLSIRLLLPILPGQFSILLSGFYGFVGLYLIGIFSFSIQGPFRREEWSIQLEKEVGRNFEEELERRLDFLLHQERIFIIPDLTLQELSRRMQIKSAALSGFLSASLGRNFNDVVNEHRVEEMKRLIRDPTTDPKATLMELAYQSGFNSKATFNRIFKEMTGMTPKAFKIKTGEEQ